MEDTAQMSKFSYIAAGYVLLLALTILVPPSRAQDDIVTNGGFETGDFTGWTTQSLSGGGFWVVYTGTLTPNDFPVQPPPEGTFAAVTYQGDQSSNILYQDIEVPPGGETMCSVIVYLVNGEGSMVDPFYVIGDGLTLNGQNQQMRVDLMDPNADPFDTGAGVLENLFQTLPGDPNNIGYTTLNFDLTPYAGQTVRFRAAVVVTTFELNGSIDELSCIAQGGSAATQIPTLSEWGMIAAAAGLGLVGLFFAVRKRRITA